ncbi:MAG: NBR1-Ig-like domain-containing protein, partial [Anaerolineae bacterium]
PSMLQPGQTITVSLALRNAGKLSWTPDDVHLGYRWLDNLGSLVAEEVKAGSISAAVSFAGSIPLTATLTAPPVTGTYTLRWDLHRSSVGWFADLSPASEPLELPVSVMNTAGLPYRLFLPLAIRGEEL